MLNSRVVSGLVGLGNMPFLKGHEDYVRFSPSPSPWLAMPGWNVETVFHDPMHCLFLGTAKVLLASMMGYWSRGGYLGQSSLEDQLRELSAEQRTVCQQHKVRGGFRTFTPASTGLDKPSEFPELGSRYKAASIKCSLWFFAKKAIDLAEHHPDDTLRKSACFWFWGGGGRSWPNPSQHCSVSVFISSEIPLCPMFQRLLDSCGTLQAKDFILKLIAVCVWSLQRGLEIQDNAEIILSPEDAEEKALLKKHGYSLPTEPLRAHV